MPFQSLSACNPCAFVFGASLGTCIFYAIQHISKESRLQILNDILRPITALTRFNPLRILRFAQEKAF